MSEQTPQAQTLNVLAEAQNPLHEAVLADHPEVIGWLPDRPRAPGGGDRGDDNCDMGIAGTAPTTDARLPHRFS